MARLYQISVIKTLYNKTQNFSKLKERKSGPKPAQNARK